MNALTFDTWQMGGGCTALHAERDGYYVLVTDGDGSDVPSLNPQEEILIGVYRTDAADATAEAEALDLHSFSSLQRMVDWVASHSNLGLGDAEDPEVAPLLPKLLAMAATMMLEGAKAIDVAGRGMARAFDETHGIEAWNTGRLYGASGQRIAAQRIGNIVAFADRDRMIDGCFEVDGDMCGLTLRQVVMANYDGGSYSHLCSSFPGEEWCQIRERLSKAAGNL